MVGTERIGRRPTKPNATIGKGNLLTYRQMSGTTGKILPGRVIEGVGKRVGREGGRELPLRNSIQSGTDEEHAWGAHVRGEVPSHEEKKGERAARRKEEPFNRMTWRVLLLRIGRVHRKRSCGDFRADRQSAMRFH